MRIVLFIAFIVCSIFSLVTEFLFPEELTLQLILNICTVLSGVLMFVFFILNENKLKTKIKEYYQYSFVKDDTIKKLEKDVNHKNQVILDYQDEIKKNTELLASSQHTEELDTAKTTISQLTNKLSLKENEIDSLNQKVNHLNNSLNSASLNNSQDNSKELEKTIQELNVALAQKNNEIEKLQLEMKKWSEKIEEIKENTSSEESIIIDDNHSEDSDKTKEECLAFLEMIKWSNHNFHCSKCENTTYNTLDNLNSRKCTKCNHIESAMAHTLYMGVRFPLDKAFDMTKAVMNNARISVEDLMEQTGLTKNTCTKFKKKILDQKGVFKKKFKRDPEHWEELIYIK